MRPTRADQNTGAALLEFPLRAAMHEKSHQQIINNFEVHFSTVAVAQWVRRWSSGHRVVQVEGSSPGGDVYEYFFSNDFYFSFVRPNGLQ